jgi:hypothetical protein
MCQEQRALVAPNETGLAEGESSPKRRRRPTNNLPIVPTNNVRVANESFGNATHGRLPRQAPRWHLI